MRNYFILDGIDSRTFGVYINGAGTFSAPARRYENIIIPGLNGIIKRTDGTYENGVLKYSGSFICKNMKTNMDAFRAFLLSRPDYVDLIDSYNPTERRRVCFEGPFEPEVTSNYKAAEFDLVFDCKPERWLLSGDTATTVNNGETKTLTNPTKFPANPLFKIYGNGSFDYSHIEMAGSQPLIVTTTITVDTVGTSQKPVCIDAETMYIYQETVNGVITNRSSFVTISTTDIPVIRPEDTATIKNVTCTKVEVIPRWWTI